MVPTRGPVIFAVVLCLLHLAVSASPEHSVGLDERLMDSIEERYQIYKSTGSREAHGDFFTSLLQVTETVRSELDQGWSFGEADNGDFAFEREGETKAFINRYGDVWGAAQEGYFMGGDNPICDTNAAAAEEAAPAPPVPQYGCAEGVLEVNAAGNGDVCRLENGDHTCPVGCTPTEGNVAPLCVWEGKTECHNTASMSAFPSSADDSTTYSKEQAASKCNELSAHLCTQDEVNHHWTSFYEAREDPSFYAWVADGEGCVVNGIQSTAEDPKVSCGYMESNKYNALCCREPLALMPAKGANKEDSASATAGKWTVAADESGNLVFKRGDESAMKIEATGKIWGSTEGTYLQPSSDIAAPNLPSTRKIKVGSFLEVEDWIVGEDQDSGNLVFYKGNQLMSMITRDGEWYSAGMCGVLHIKGHAKRTPGPVHYKVSTKTVDCTVTSWSQWNDCSQGCGGGVQSRSRSIVTQASNGGAICPLLEETRGCNTQGCPRDCDVTEWSAWSECSVKCGGGQSLRSRNVSSYPSSSGRPCPGMSEAKPCNNEVCGADMCRTMTGSFAVDLNSKDMLVAFAGNRWTEYSQENAMVTRKQHEITDEASMFSMFPEPFASKINAAVNGPSGKGVYFFSSGLDDEGTERSQWLLYDVATSQVLRGPYGMNVGAFGALPEPFNHTISAAVNRGGPDMNEAYFFSGTKWLLFDMSSNAIVEGPYEINVHHSLNLPAPFNQGVTSAVPGQGDTATLFSGNEWLTWNLNTRKVVAGPFLLGVHPRFKQLAESLNVCTGYDLQSLGSYYQRLRQIIPVPVGKATRVTGLAGQAGYSDGEEADTVKLNKPEGMVLLDDVLYLVDTQNHAIRKVDVATGATTTVAGGVTNTSGFKDGVGADARFSSPSGIAGARLGAPEEGDLLYIADTMNHAIRRVWIPKGHTDGVVATVAGGGANQCEQCDPSGSSSCKSCCNCNQIVMGFRDHPIGREALFAEPRGISLAYDPEAKSLKGRNEVLYVADSKNHAIRRLMKAPGEKFAEVVTVAGGQKAAPSAPGYAQRSVPYQWGEELGAPGNSDGSGGQAAFHSPSDVALVKQENNHILYVADTENNRVARVAVSVRLTQTQKVTVPILTVTSTQEDMSGLVAQSVAPGTEFVWDSELQQWTDPSSVIPSASMCPPAGVTVPFSFTMVLAGHYHVNELYFEWAHGGAKDYQIAFSQDGESWVTAVTKKGLAARAAEQVGLPHALQKYSTGFVRIGITALNEETFQMPVVRMIGQIVDSDIPSVPVVDTQLSSQSCSELGWMSINGVSVCSSAKVSNSSCLPDIEKSMAFQEAEATCQAAGARLCSVEELEKQSNNPAVGCGIDDQRVWTSTPCGCGGHLSQASKLDKQDPMAVMPRICSADTETLVVQCCADKPPELVTELGEDATETPVEMSSVQELDRARFTDGNGTAPEDSACTFPFVVQGEAFNNCTMIEDGSKLPGSFGWCPVKHATHAEETSNGIMLVTEATEWGSCREPGYKPPECIMSPWTGWGACSAVCGGGTKSRKRSIVAQYGHNPVCGGTEDMAICNKHECGFVDTIAGGSALGLSMGLGLRESPYNPLWITRNASRSPDLHYKPVAIDVAEQSGGLHAVFVAGVERTRADNVDYIRRIDVAHFTPEDEGGAGAPEACVDISKYERPDLIPASAAACRIIHSVGGFSSARVAAIELDEQDVGIRFQGASAIVANSESSLFLTSSASIVSKLDLSQQIQCQGWMTEGLRQWDVSPDSEPRRSSPVKLQLKSLSGSSTSWQLAVTRTVGDFKSLGMLPNYQANMVGDSYLWEKNMLCASPTEDGTATKCCVAKQAQNLPPPRPCPKPVQEACLVKYTMAMQDYEYALQLVQRNLNVGVSS